MIEGGYAVYGLLLLVWMGAGLAAVPPRAEHCLTPAASDIKTRVWTESWAPGRVDERQLKHRRIARCLIMPHIIDPLTRFAIDGWDSTTTVFVLEIKGR